MQKFCVDSGIKCLTIFKQVFNYFSSIIFGSFDYSSISIAMDCLRAPLYNTCRICFDSGTEQYEAFNDNSSLKPIPTNTYRGGIVLYVDTDLNDLKF